MNHRTFETVFKVRYYECDGWGYVYDANFLRYSMQAIADLTADLGFDILQGEIPWRLQRVRIGFFQPLLEAGTFTVRSWMSAWRNMGVVIEQEIFSGNDSKVARVTSDWEFLDRASQEPLATPSSVLSEFFPSGMPTEADSPEPWPDAPSAPPQVFSAIRKVRPRHISLMGSMDYANFINLFDEIAMDAEEFARLSAGRLLSGSEEDYDFMVTHHVPTGHQIEFLEPVYDGAELRIKSYVGRVNPSSHERHYTVSLSEGQLAVRACTEWTCVDPESMQVMPVPDIWYQYMADQISDEED